MKKCNGWMDEYLYLGVDIKIAVKTIKITKS